MVHFEEEEVEKSVTEKLARENDELRRRTERMRTEINDLKAHCRTLSCENTKLGLQGKSMNASRQSQRIQRLDASRKTWRKKYLNLRTTSANVVGLRNKLKKAKAIASFVKKVESSKKEMSKRHMKSKQDLKLRLERKFTESTNVMIKEMTAKHSALKHAEANIKAFEKKCLELSKELESTKHDALQAKEDGKTYCKEVREASYILQIYGVAPANVPKACSEVYRALTGKEIVGQLPQYTSQNNFFKEMKTLARQKEKEVLLGDD